MKHVWNHMTGTHLGEHVATEPSGHVCAYHEVLGWSFTRPADVVTLPGELHGRVLPLKILPTFPRVGDRPRIETYGYWGPIIGRDGAGQPVFLSGYLRQDEDGDALFSSWGVLLRDPPKVSTEESHAYNQGYQSVHRSGRFEVIPPNRLDGHKPGRSGWRVELARIAGIFDATAALGLVREVAEAHREALERATTNKVAADNELGRYELRHHYGHSYKGIGNAWGSVEAVVNATTESTQDNGFVSGPRYVTVVDATQPAYFFARGGDAIGEGREWSERGTWYPSWRRWVVSVS